ncbi:MAG: phosphohydrolase [Verrucomicrobiales bacterium]|nr:phosphohydrolase [Verrucomicrobiales bacterium]
MENTATGLVRKLQEAGYIAYFAGGCVRDRLRDVVPKDFDIATNATPEQVLRIFPGSGTVGAHFGVVLVRRDGEHFEIATFREDGEYKDGRRPESVLFSSPEEDAKRRDFTINGMFFDPIAEELIDYVGGQSDLKAGTIRAIGIPTHRFQEDFLRMLRAIRFATVFNFQIEDETWNSIQKTAEKITTISPERIREELDKIWKSPNRVRGFDLLVDSGLMKAILPEILTLQGCDQPPQWHPEGDVFTHTRLMLTHLTPDASLPLVLSVLFHDIAKPATYTYDEEAERIRFNGHDKIGAEMTEEILKRLRYPNHIIDVVVGAVDQHMKFKDVQKMRKAKLKRFMARENFEVELELHHVDCLGSNGRLGNYDFIQQKRKEFSEAPLIPEKFLDGRDLIERGISPGPELGKILTEIQDLQLEGVLTSRKEALDWLEEHLANR